MIQSQVVLFDQLAAVHAMSFPLLALTPRQLAEVIANGISAGTKPSITDWQVYLPILFSAGALWLTRQSARDAKVSAKAAQVSADVAAASQRPRFVVVEMKITHAYLKEDESLEGVVSIDLRNYGASTAEIITKRCTFAVSSSFPDEPRYPGPPKYRVGSEEIQRQFGIIVSAEISEHMECLIRLEPLQLAAVRSGAAKLWVYGCVAYRDCIDERWVKGFVGVLPFVQRDLLLNPIAHLVRPNAGGARYEFSRRGFIDESGAFVPE
ncbi:hypothetical protein CBA19CS11_19375 [Caballeronia novacaledonica]|uniref:hypothetical protein n=1 Tax=Caballeronia novacaledonica TaxID=1544861 RepID=UPI001EE19D29|nr:hypothetical protein [Caballeronia novacaledonica]GJH11035.1 hypothetical protein CBA19CS11_19375 [Caballeronia novacaledonica]